MFFLLDHQLFHHFRAGDQHILGYQGLLLLQDFQRIRFLIRGQFESVLNLSDFLLVGNLLLPSDVWHQLLSDSVNGGLITVDHSLLKLDSEGPASGLHFLARGEVLFDKECLVLPDHVLFEHAEKHTESRVAYYGLEGKSHFVLAKKDPQMVHHF